MLIALTGLAASSAADIEGTVVIKHKLTRRKVTLSAGPYDRGIPVAVGGDASIDPLAYERTHVVIYLDDAASGGKPEGPPVVMEQKDRRFVPDLLVIPAGATVSFPNLDPIFHNVFSLSKVKSFDLGNYSRGHTRLVAFPKPGIVLVNCRLHSNMSAAIVVTPDRYSAVPDAAGRFTLRHVPPGRHAVVAWHKTAGYFRESVTTTETRGARVEFVIPVDENGKRAVAQR